jgi:uncharacterized RDD family membrane protein YckC
MFACPNHPTDFQTRRCSRCGRAFCKNCLVLLRGSYFCADCKTEQVRDVQSGTDASVPEYASVGRRFGALFVDGLLQGVVSWAILIPLMLALPSLAAAVEADPNGPAPSGAAIGLMLVVYGVLFTIPVVYEGLMLSRNGQTLGKMALGIKVVTADGGDISRGQAWGRALMRLVLNFCLLIDYIPAMFTPDKKTIHDMAAGTRVVRIQS